MDRQGQDWCRANRQAIADKLRESADQRGWGAKLLAAGMSVTAGIVLTIDLADPYGWIVDEAIRRAEAEAEAA